MKAISVIIGTYNSLPSMELCLASLERQDFKDFEVIIADDGSGPEVKKWLEKYHPDFSITHIWHEDKGFRKCKILNHALKHSKGEYIVFLDADCILAKNFLSVHWQNREPGAFLGGRRVMIKEAFAGEITRALIDAGRFDGFNVWGLYQSLIKNFKYYEETIKALHRIKKRKYLDFVGSNFSVFRSDLYKINGFDEDYEHRGGGEDTDIAWRLHAAGVHFKSLRCLAVQFHLGHRIGEKKTASANMFLEKQKKVKTLQDARNIRSSLTGKHENDYSVIRSYEKKKNSFS